MTATYPWSVGAIQAHTLIDGSFTASFDWLGGIDAAECCKVLQAAGQPSEPVVTVNAFLLQTGGRIVLVDAGIGTAPGFGGVGAGLRSLGIAPDAVTAILLTHLHGDHIGGLVDGAGAAVFPRASVHVSQLELDYWMDGGMAARVSESERAKFTKVQTTLAPYRAALRPFTGEVELFPGIHTVPLAGHTHGHTGFRLHSNDAEALIWGDVVNFPEVQAAKPDVTVQFDIDRPTSIETRMRVLGSMADTGCLVAGAHLRIPGVAHVKRRETGFAIIPKAMATPA